jgi:hypothetical protein
MLIKLVEGLLVILLIWTLFLQVMIPLIRGSKLFPMFKKEAKLRSDLESVNQSVIEKELEQRIKSTKKEKGVK